MIYFILARISSLLLDIFALTRHSDHHKDLQILLLRQQLRILQRQLLQRQLLQRQHPHAPRISRVEKLALAVLAAKFAAFRCGGCDRLDQVALFFKPDTLLKWHRDLVHRKWTFIKRYKAGRPSTNVEIKELLLRLAKANPTWGYSKLQGELLKLGYDIGRSTVRDVLKRQHVPPAPERAKVRRQVADIPWALQAADAGL